MLLGVAFGVKIMLKLYFELGVLRGIVDSDKNVLNSYFAKCKDFEGHLSIDRAILAGYDGFCSSDTCRNTFPNR